jgi:hypothetical protein
MNRNKRNSMATQQIEETVQITKRGDNDLQIAFYIENHGVNLTELIHFNLFDILFKINKDICESYRLDVCNDCEARLQLVLKHILGDLGVPQMWGNVIIMRENLGDMVVLTVENAPVSETVVGEDYKLIPVKNVTVYCDIKNPHKIDIRVDVAFSDEKEDCEDDEEEGYSSNMQHFLDKMTKTLVKNIINRLKQFIENMTYTTNHHLC